MYYIPHITVHINMKKLLLILLTLTIYSVSFGQSMPEWIYKLPKPGNNTYLYEKEMGLGSTENEARNQAIARVFQSTALRIGQPISSDEIFRAVQNNTEFSVIARTFKLNVHKVCEYPTRTVDGNYKVYILYQVAKAGNIEPRFDYNFDECYHVQQYSNASALLKSMFIPGLGQIGKRHYAEGILTLTGEVLLVGVGIGCYYSAQHQLDIMKKDNVSYSDFADATSKYNSLQTTSYFIWGAAAALYVFNLLRAVTLHPLYKETLAFYPAVNTNGDNLALGFGLTYKF